MGKRERKETINDMSPKRYVYKFLAGVEGDPHSIPDKRFRFYSAMTMWGKLLLLGLSSQQLTDTTNTCCSTRILCIM